MRFFNFNCAQTTSKREAIHYSVAGLRFISNWKPMLVNLKSECWKSDTQYLCQNVGIIFKLRLDNSHYSVTWPKGSEHFYPCCRYHVFISLLNNARCVCMCMCKREIKIIGNFLDFSFRVCRISIGRVIFTFFSFRFFLLRSDPVAVRCYRFKSLVRIFPSTLIFDCSSNCQLHSNCNGAAI